MAVNTAAANAALMQVTLGLKVDRAAATHAAATTPYFHIYGGRVLMTALVGTITTASGANVCSWVANATTGTATQPVSGNLDINPAVVGDSLTITGVGSAAMTYNASATGLASMSTPVVLNIGTLDLIAAAADGATKWSMWYIPLDDGAYVLAV